MRGSLSVGVEAVKVTDMSKVDVDVLFGIFDVLSVSLVDNDLADERSQDFGRKLLDVCVLADYFKETFHIGGRCL